MRLSTLILLLLTSVPTATLQAQGLNDVLQQIEENNLSLKAINENIIAGDLRNRAASNLPDPSISYTSVYTNGAAPGHATEFSATQSLQVPTYYLQRNKQNRLALSALQADYQVAKQTVLLEAKQQCLDLIYFGKIATLLQHRTQSIHQLALRLDSAARMGNVNQLDNHRTAMEQMSLIATTKQNDANIRAAVQALHALNGGLPLNIENLHYPKVVLPRNFTTLQDQATASDANILQAKAQLSAARGQIKVARQGWMPSINAGFKRSTDNAHSMNGFVVGMSIPLFANQKVAKAAKAEALQKQWNYEDAMLKTTSQLMALHAEALQLEEALEVYAPEVIHSTIELLESALIEGHINLMQYFTESEKAYQTLLQQLELERQYHKVAAQLFKFEL